MGKIETEVAVIYSDGSTIPTNPGPGGWAFVVLVDGEPIQERYGHSGKTTNNRMEMLAVINGIKWVVNNLIVSRIVVISDSMYVVCGINSWAEKWEKASFTGKANRDLWEELLTLKKKNKIFCKHVRAHNGDLYNERCDVLANMAASGKVTNVQDLT